MKTTKLWSILLVILAIFSFVSCDDDPEYADPEAREKTAQLNEQFASLIVGTWCIEDITDKAQFYERLTFHEDGTLTGVRKWQVRSLVTIDGQQRYTDWEEIKEMDGAFTGKWRLLWERDINGVGHNRLNLYARYDDQDNGSLAYSHSNLFDYCDNVVLRFSGYVVSDDNWSTYRRGDTEPSF